LRKVWAMRPRTISAIRSSSLALTIATAYACGQPLSAKASILGVYGGNDPENITQFERWLGCPVQQILVFTDGRTWINIAHPQWFMTQFAGLDRPALWSIPLIPNGSSLDAAATGAFDTNYVSAALALQNARAGAQGRIGIRPGWELNGDWFPWAAEGKEQAYIATFRHFVDSFRSVSSKFRFEWNINHGRHMDPAAAYPGDKYVDVVGIDFYWMPQYLGNDPVEAFTKIRDGNYGLRYVQEFANAHGKPVAFTEWGVRGDDAEPFIKLVHEWIDTNHIIYHNYWNSDAAFPGFLSGGRWPQAGAAFRRAFCPHGPSADGNGSPK